MRYISKDKLTESALFYLLRRQSKDFKQLNHYFDQYFSHSGGDTGEDFETAKVMFETFKKLNQCIITGANSLSGLSILGVKTTNAGKQAKGYILRVGDQRLQILPSLVGISAEWMMNFSQRVC